MRPYTDGFSLQPRRGFFFRWNRPALQCRVLLVAVLAIAGFLAPAVAQTSDAPPVPGPVTPLPGVTFHVDHFSGTPDQARMDNAQIIYNNELSVQANTIQGNLLTQEYLASGGVTVHEADTTLKSQSLQFDGPHKRGVAQDAVLEHPAFTLRAQQIDLDDSFLQAHKVSLTDVPPDVSPDIEVRAQTLDLYPKENRGVLRNASLYLFHTRILTLKHVPFRHGSGTGGQRRLILPSPGISSRYGAYLTFGGALSRPVPIYYFVLLPTRQTPQIRLTAQQTLLSRPAPAAPPPPEAVPARREYLGALRRLATAYQPPLPPGDPLLFHNYLPEDEVIRPLERPSLGSVVLHEEVSSHFEAQVHRRDLVYVSRLPEVSVYGQFPLNALSSPPPVGDPVALRQSLRHLTLLGNAEVGTGYFEEQPLNLHATRQRFSIGLTTSPLLIAPNTLFLPRLQTTVNYYSGRRSTYRFAQAGADVAHYFSPYSAVSVGLSTASTHGASPFNFDVLDTTQEFDGRVQLGNRRLAVGARFRYDLLRRAFIDYELAVAPGLHGFTPIVSYTFRSRNIGLGIDVPILQY